jgi:alpha-L-fucosidase 2
LEGNFAAAAGLQEMLLQSYSGTIRVFPAIPADWKDVSFKTLRAEGAFLVSASREDGSTQSVEITSEKGGLCRIENPFKGAEYEVKGVVRKAITRHGNDLTIKTTPGQKIVIAQRRD